MVKDSSTKSPEISSSDSSSPDSVESSIKLIHALSSSVNVETVIDKWILSYKEDSKFATLNLIQLFIDAAGFRTQLTVDNIGKQENCKELLESFLDKIPEERDAPISAKRFQVTLSVFFQRLILKCDSIIFDCYLLDTLFSILVPMTRSKLRVFRLVGTLAALKLMTSLLNVQAEISKQLSMARRQLKAEQSKDRRRQTEDRLDTLTNMISTLENNERELGGLINDYAVKVIFKRRVQDVMTEIQILCLNEVSVWMQMDKKTFMIDRFLVYYKLLLPSHSITVRRTCLKALLLFYENDEHVEELKLFTKKSVHQFATMALDQALDVSALAISLLVQVLRMYGPSMLETSCEEVFYLVFSRHKVVAEAAGVFVAAWFESVQRSANESPPKTRPSIAILTNMAEFLEEARLPDHAPFLVDALLPVCPALLDWDAALTLLAHDATESEANEELKLDLETCLVKLVAATVHQVCSGESPRLGKKVKAKSGKVAQRLQQYCLEVTDAFLPSLPSMLHRHRSDADKVRLLLGIAEHFKLSRITLRKQQKLENLVKVFESLIEIHSEKSVIVGCCRVMNHLYTEIDSPSAPYFLIWETIEGKHYCNFINALDDVGKCFQRDTNPNMDQVYSLVNCSTKLAILHEHRDLGTDRLWNVTLNYIARALKFSILPGQVILDFIKICHLSLLYTWKMLKENDDGNVDDDITSLKKKVLQFNYVLEELMKHQIRDFKIRAFFVLCDIFLVFGKDVNNQNSNGVFIPISNYQQELIQKFIVKNVFMEHLVKKTKKGKGIELRKSALKSYCRLFTNNIIPYENVSWILKYYGGSYIEYEETLKETLIKMLQSNEEECAEALMNSISSSLLSDKNENVTSSIQKIVTEKITLFYPQLIQYPNALVKFHSTGINLAFHEDEHNTDKTFLLKILANYVEKLSQSQCFMLLETLKYHEENNPKKSKAVASYKLVLSRVCRSYAPNKRRKVSQNTQEKLISQKGKKVSESPKCTLNFTHIFSYST